jgi:hypothetical protein
MPLCNPVQNKGSEHAGDLSSNPLSVSDPQSIKCQGLTVITESAEFESEKK